MNYAAPHFLLVAETIIQHQCSNELWRFELQRVGARDAIVESDCDPGVFGERLELLAVIRGLEALDQPSRVTLLTVSSYVQRGLQKGLGKWRAAEWQWESASQIRPIKDADLWQRLDQILEIHTVDCRNWRISAGQNNLPTIGLSVHEIQSADSPGDDPQYRPALEEPGTTQAVPRPIGWLNSLARKLRNVAGVLV